MDRNFFPKEAIMKKYFMDFSILYFHFIVLFFSYLLYFFYYYFLLKFTQIIFLILKVQYKVWFKKFENFSICGCCYPSLGFWNLKNWNEIFRWQKNRIKKIVIKFHNKNELKFCTDARAPGRCNVLRNFLEKYVFA